MKVFKTVLWGAVLLTAGLSSMTGCSDDEAPAAGSSGAGGGTGATGGAAGSSGASGSGGGGSSGRGGSAGSGGSTSDAAVCTGAPTAMQIAECKTRGATSGSCNALVQCACDNCTCELADCEASATCTAIRQCVSRTGCCPTGREAECGTGRPACTMACSAEIAAGQMDNGLTLVLAVNMCVNAMRDAGQCPLCPYDGGTGDGGGRDGSGGTGGAADSGGGG